MSTNRFGRNKQRFGPKTHIGQGQASYFCQRKFQCKYCDPNRRFVGNKTAVTTSEFVKDKQFE